MNELNILSIGLIVVGVICIAVGVLSVFFPRWGFGWDKFWYKLRGLTIEPDRAYNMLERLKGIYSIVVGVVLIVAAYLILARA